MKKNVKDNDIGNTKYTLLQFHLQTTIQIQNKVSKAKMQENVI
jgi:hypothetical protein